MPDDAFGNMPPMGPISGFQPLAYGRLEMDYNQMLGSMLAPRGVPQLGGMIGQTGQQAINMFYPILQNMMRQQAMAQGVSMPIFAGGGPAIDQLQAFRFQDTLREAMGKAYQDDLPRLIARAGGPESVMGGMVAGLGNLPMGMSNMIMPAISQFIAPEGLQGDLVRGALAATRGKLTAGEANQFGAALFGRLSTGDRFDLSKTGGMTAGQVGELMFEMQRRGNTLLFDQKALEGIGAPAGTPLENLQAAGVSTKIGQIGDILGTVNEMLGGNQPLSKLLDAIEGLAGKNILAPGFNADTLRQQISQLRGTADLLGVAPAAMGAMMQATNMNLRGMGLQALTIPATTQQMILSRTGLIAANAAGLDNMPGADVTPGAIGAAAGQVQAGMLGSYNAKILGVFGLMRAAGKGGDALARFYGMNAQQQADLMADPTEMRSMMAQVESTDPTLFRNALRMDTAAKFMGEGGMGTLFRVSRANYLSSTRRLLAMKGYGTRGAAIVDRMARGEKMTDDDMAVLATTDEEMRSMVGFGAGEAAALFGSQSDTVFSAMEERSKFAGQRRNVYNQLQQAGDASFFGRMADAGTTAGGVLSALLGQVNLGGKKGVSEEDVAKIMANAGSPEGKAALEKWTAAGLHLATLEANPLIGDAEAVHEAEVARNKAKEELDRLMTAPIDYAGVIKGMTGISEEQRGQMLKEVQRYEDVMKSGADSPGGRPGQTVATGQAFELTVKVITDKSETTNIFGKASGGAGVNVPKQTVVVRTGG